MQVPVLRPFYGTGRGRRVSGVAIGGHLTANRPDGNRNREDRGQRVVDIELTGLFGTREAADDLVASAGIANDLTGTQVVLYCRDMLSGSTSFADQLVRTLVVDRDAKSVALVGAPERFARHMNESAHRRGVSDRVREESAAQIA